MERKPLDTFPALQPPSGGLGLVLFGAVFVAAGGAIILAAAGVLPVAEESFEAPRWLAATVGGIFAVPGLLLAAHGVRGALRAARLARGLAAHPDEPWRFDHAWPEGRIGARTNSIVGAFFGALALTGFMVPFNYILATQRFDLFMVIFWLFIGLFDVIAVVVWGAAFYTLFRRLKYMGAAVEYDEMPMHVGGEVRVRFCAPARFADAEEATFTLRCVVEQTQIEKTSDGTRSTTRCFAVHEEAKRLGRSEIAADRVPVAFTIPADAPPTQISAQPPTYWDLEVAAEAPGIDYRGHFLLPIY